MTICHQARATKAVGCVIGFLLVSAAPVASAKFVQMSVQQPGPGTADCLKVTLPVPLLFAPFVQDPLQWKFDPRVPPTQIKKGGTFCEYYDLSSLPLPNPLPCFAGSEGIPRFQTVTVMPDTILFGPTELTFRDPRIGGSVVGVPAGRGENLGWTDPGPETNIDGTSNWHIPSIVQWRTGTNCEQSVGAGGIVWYLPFHVQFRFGHTSGPVAPVAPVAPSALALNPLGPTQVPANATFTQALPVAVPAGSFVIVKVDTLNPNRTDGTVSTTVLLETDAAPAGGASSAVVTFRNGPTPLTIQTVYFAVSASQIDLEDLDTENTTLTSQLAPLTPAPSCVDGVRNGLETGTDCGGGACPRCPTGQTCSVPGDCLSGICQGGVCQQGPGASVPAASPWGLLMLASGLCVLGIFLGRRAHRRR